jgi:hypothetical protein
MLIIWRRSFTLQKRENWTKIYCLISILLNRREKKKPLLSDMSPKLPYR